MAKGTCLCAKDTVTNHHPRHCKWTVFSITIRTILGVSVLSPSSLKVLSKQHVSLQNDSLHFPEDFRLLVTKTNHAPHTLLVEILNSNFCICTGLHFFCDKQLETSVQTDCTTDCRQPNTVTHATMVPAECH